MSQLHVPVIALSGDVSPVTPEFLELTKAALLFGDSVAVVSPIPSLLRFMARTDMSPTEIVEGLYQRFLPLPIAIVPEPVRTMMLLRRKTALSGDERAALKSIEAHIVRALQTPPFEQQTVPITEMQAAEASGLVVFHDIPYDPERGHPAFAAAVELELAKPGSLALLSPKVAEAVSGSGSFRLGVTEVSVAHAASAGAGSKAIPALREALKNLPGVPPASMEEILQLRGECESSLIRLRAEFLILSESLPDYDGSADFNQAVDVELAKTVLPAIQDLERDMQDNRFFKRLSDRALSSGTASRLVAEGVAALSIGLARPDLLMYTPLALAAEAAQLAIGAFSDYQQGVAKVASDPFYLFVRLSKGRGR